MLASKLMVPVILQCSSGEQTKQWNGDTRLHILEGYFDFELLQFLDQSLFILLLEWIPINLMESSSAHWNINCAIFRDVDFRGLKSARTRKYSVFLYFNLLANTTFIFLLIIFSDIQKLRNPSLSNYQGLLF